MDWMVREVIYSSRGTDDSVIYHIAPHLDAEGHRRLVGNDIAIVRR